MLEESEWEEEEFEEEEELEEEYLGSGVEKEVVGRKTSEEEGMARKVLTDVDVLASEILTNKKLLAVFLELGERPKQAKELVSARIYVKAKVKDRYGDYEKYVGKKLPQSTMYRLLKKLVNTGLAEVYRGIDFRKRYYKLTELGKKVLNKVLEVIKETLKDYMDKIDYEYTKQYEVLSKYKGYRVLTESEFKNVVAKLFSVNPSLIIKLLNAIKERKSYSENFILIDYGEKEEKRGFSY